MTARYFAQRQALGEKGAAEWNNYLPLSYREVSYGPVMKGANGFFPYDDILNEEQRNDIQDFFADTLDAERAEDFTQFILAEYIRRDLRFRVCKFCRRYFGIMGNTRLEFCDRLIDGSTKPARRWVLSGFTRNGSWRSQPSGSISAPTRPTTPVSAMV